MCIRDRLWIAQAFEIAFTGRQVDPGVCLATEQSPFPWGHAKESFCHCAERIDLSVQAGEATDELVSSHALGLEKECVRRISAEPPVTRKQPAFAQEARV